MGTTKVFAVLGGDLRQVHIANMLARQGYVVYALFFNDTIEFDERVLLPMQASDAIALSDVLILPMPVSTDNVHLNAAFCPHKVRLDDCLDAVQKNAVIFGGKIGPTLRELCVSRSLTVEDYLEREELAVRNAVPTAEGAIGIAMQELPTTLFGQRCLITGFGRISKVLLHLLTAMQANVTVAARKYSDLAWIEVYGGHAVHISELPQAIAQADVVFNTVPAHILDAEVLARLPKDALVIDLASSPGGVDFECAKRLGIKAIWALSLPGKVAPHTAGEIIKDTILNMLRERGEL